VPKEVLEKKALDAKSWLAEVAKVVGGKVSAVGEMEWVRKRELMCRVAGGTSRVSVWGPR
jgi:hypothetical protein